MICMKYVWRSSLRDLWEALVIPFVRQLLYDTPHLRTLRFKLIIHSQLPFASRQTTFVEHMRSRRVDNDKADQNDGSV